MQDWIEVTGMVIKGLPIGEYDKRITILTRERGKISAFAKGARRPNSRLMAATSPFSFGVFKLFEGKNSYNIMDVSIDNFFEGMREDFEAAYYGMYFLEIADFYTRENNDDKEMLRLLYQSVRALQVKSIPNMLVQSVYEIKSLAVNGEFPGIKDAAKWDSDTLYTVEYIVNSPIEKLYTFAVSDPVLLQLMELSSWYREKYISTGFKSLEILENCRLKN